MLANLTPSQEPAAYGAVATAILGVIVVFLPRFGVHLSSDEYTAIAAAAAVVVPVLIGLVVRQNVTPVANVTHTQVSPAAPAAQPPATPPAA